MKKKRRILIIIIAIIIIIALVFLNIINYQKEQKLLKENEKIIKESYVSLSENIKNYNQIRTELTEKLSNFFLESFEKEKDSYDVLLNSYNNNITKIDKDIYKIEQKCHIIYKDSSTNTICSNYSNIYEKIINLYVTDLTNYNNNIKEYNKYKNATISLSKMIHQEYIDYNNDHKYEGKEVKNGET